MIGEIPGIVAGAQFANRRALYDAGVHRALQKGIVGAAPTGAESIVLSGGYVDDEDNGDEIIYTGRGGRDVKTGCQIADQHFFAENKALVTSRLEGLPVRVIRGAEHNSPYSPQDGYRFDGLFWVEDHWRERGKDGFLVCRYKLVSKEARIEDDTYAPQQPGGPAARTHLSLLRIVRDTAVGKRVKALHDYACQICGVRLETGAGPYAEAAHIRPLGRPHNGPDVTSNVLCLCPNHHVLFDYGVFCVANDLSLIGLPGRLRVSRKHTLDSSHLGYHRAMWRQ
jgi:putative restriction endonuclease